MSLPNAVSPTPLNELPTAVPPTASVGRTAPVPSTAQTGEGPFVDRRQQGGSKGAGERRQFGSSHDGLSEAGRELALAIDQYKLQHHRRYITCDEMLHVITSLGYSK